jgi:hypothetical protein
MSSRPARLKMKRKKRKKGTAGEGAVSRYCMMSIQTCETKKKKH